MKETTTDGRVIIIPDMCTGCSLNTAGQHEIGCPLNPGVHVDWDYGMIAAQAREGIIKSGSSRAGR